MKNILTYKVLIITGVLFFSCNKDFLDTYPLDKFNQRVVWEDEEFAQGFVNATAKDVSELLTKVAWYRYGDNNDGNNYGGQCDDWSDNMAIKQSHVYHRNTLSDENETGWSKVGTRDNYIFETIRACNLIIEEPGKYDVMDENAQRRIVSQGKLLRGLTNFNQARKFGRIIKLDRVLTIDDDFELPRTETIKETYDFILQDLREAADGLEPDERRAAGGYNKGTALAFLAEAALQGAAYLDNSADKNEYYALAKEASEELFEMDFTLDTKYGDMFSDPEYGIESNEIILSYHKHSENTKLSYTPQQRIKANISSTKNGPQFSNPPIVFAIEGWAARWPTVSLVNDYLVVDEDGIAKFWNETTYYQDFEANGGYVSKAIYKNRDARFYASIVYDSSSYYLETATTRVGGNMHTLSNIKEPLWAMTNTGYYCRKGLNEKLASSMNASENTDHVYVLMRLGRAYLNYAEVMLRLNQPSVAVEYINKTRVEHGKLPELSTGISLTDAWKWYKVERRVELFFENDRFWCLLRWGKEDDLAVIPELDGGLQQINISADGQSFELLDELLDKNDLNIKTWDSRKYLLPIHRDELLQNKALDQNPGW